MDEYTAILAELMGQSPMPFNPLHLTPTMWLSDNSQFVALAQPSVTAPDALDTWATAVEVTRTPNVANGPDGTLIADRIADTTANNSHYCGTPVSGHVTGVPATCSLNVKYESRRWVIVQCGGSYTTFDVQNGVLGTVSVGLTSRAIAPLGNGWYRCEILTTGGATTDAFMQLRSGDNAGSSYVGDGSSVLACGMCVTQNRAQQVNDRSPVLTQVTTDVRQATAANQPLWCASDPLMGGYPSIDFDGVNDYLQAQGSAAAWQFMQDGSGYTRVMSLYLEALPSALGAIADTANLASGTAQGNSLYMGTAGAGHLTLAIWDNNLSVASITVNDALAAATPYVISDSYLEGAATEVFLRRNGTQIGSGAGTQRSPHTGPNNTLILGARQAGASPLHVRIGQIGIWNRRLSDDELLRVERYMGRRIGASVA